MPRGDFSTDAGVAQEQRRHAATNWRLLRAAVGVLGLVDAASWLIALLSGDPVSPFADTGMTAWGWLVSLLGIAVTLVLLIRGPQPWRATRWGWFWLSGVPFGLLAFAVLSGPTPGVSPPRDLHRRVAGGPAFLVATAVTVVLALLFR